MATRRPMTPREIAKKRRGGKAAKAAQESRTGAKGTGMDLRRPSYQNPNPFGKGKQ
jgi:hypothetical protein